MGLELFWEETACEDTVDGSCLQPGKGLSQTLTTLVPGSRTPCKVLRGTIIFRALLLANFPTLGVHCLPVSPTVSLVHEKVSARSSWPKGVFRLRSFPLRQIRPVLDHPSDLQPASHWDHICYLGPFNCLHSKCVPLASSQRPLLTELSSLWTTSLSNLRTPEMPSLFHVSHFHGHHFTPCWGQTQSHRAVV